MAIFLSNSNLVEKPPVPVQTKKHLPKVKKKEGEGDNKGSAKPAEAPKADTKPEEKPQAEAPKADTKPEEKPQEEKKSEENSEKKE